MELIKPQFIHEDAKAIIAEMKADLESRLNRSISPADVEMLLIQAFAYRETLIRIGVNEAARQNLVSFSSGSALEYLGLLVGVVRLPAASALTILRFALVPNHTGVLLPADIRVQSIDGKSIFITTESKIVPIGELSIDVKAESTVPGVSGNGYDIGKVSIILDPQAFIVTAQNIDITAGGADMETDEELRERIKLAPASFSVAGPKGAYIYFAKSAHPSIVDVAITSPVPGEVHIFPLLEGGALPNQLVLDAVYATCNAEKIRPITDTVIVAAPASLDYEIEIQLTVLNGAINNEIVTQVMSNLNAFQEERKNKLGRDVVRSQIIALCMIKDKVYDVTVIKPVADIIAAPEVYTNCENILISVTGTHDE